jgi:hypothetical protein
MNKIANFRLGFFKIVVLCMLSQLHFDIIKVFADAECYGYLRRGGRLKPRGLPRRD